MKILHYSLGYPPYARGGLTKYAVDVAMEQKKHGHDVAMLWPGTIMRFGCPKIVKTRDYFGIKSYELKNPEFLPQIYGIKEFEQFQVDVNTKVYIKFLQKMKPDIIHIHTLMGMHINFLEAARQLGVKTVYTTHDFFGICPKSTLFFNKKSCKDNFDCSGCAVCCENALGINKMRVLQSRFYRSVKNTKIVQKVRLNQKEKVFALEDEVKEVDENNELAKERYARLREGYLEYFKRITVIHFNSSYMKAVFEKYMNIDKGIVCNITHSQIKDNKYQYNKVIQNHVLQITYMGPIAEYKGFYLLKNVLDKLYEEGMQNFQLTIYHEISNPEPYMKVMPPYRYENLNQVMNRADIVVALHDVSYGFTVLEALSYGVPVFVTEEVGAKDLIIHNETGVICEYNFESVKENIRSLLEDLEKVESMKKNIKEKFKVPEMEEHIKELIETVYK